MCTVINSPKVQMHMKTMGGKKEANMQGESYHWAGWANADIFCFMMVESMVTWCDIVMNKTNSGQPHD